MNFFSSMISWLLGEERRKKRLSWQASEEIIRRSWNRKFLWNIHRTMQRSIFVKSWLLIGGEGWGGLTHSQLSAKWSHPAAQYHVNKITCVISVLPLENCKEIGLLSGFKSVVSPSPYAPFFFLTVSLLSSLGGWASFSRMSECLRMVPWHLKIVCVKVWPSAPWAITGPMEKGALFTQLVQSQLVSR